MRRRLLAIPIKWQLTVLVLVTMLPLVTGLLAVYLDTTANHYQSVVDNTKSCSLTFKHEQQALLSNAYTLLSTLADVVGHEDNAELLATFTRIQRRSPEYYNLLFISRNGYSQVSVLPDKHTYLGDRQYFKDAVANRQFFVGSFQVGRISGKPSINCGYPVTGPTGEVIGVVAVSVRLTQLAAMARRTNLPDGVELVMSDRQGAVLASTNSNTKLGSPEPNFIKALLRNSISPNLITEKTDNGSVYHHIVVLKANQMKEPYGYFRVSIPRSRILETTHKRSAVLFAMLIVFISLPLFLSYIVGHRYISKRLDTVVMAARKLQSGDLSARSSLTDDLGEIGLLSRTFNDMAGSIQNWDRQHKWAEKQMRESESRYRNLVEQLPAATYVVAVSGNEMEVLFLNSHIVDISGYERADFTADPHLWAKIIYTDDSDAYRSFTNAISHDDIQELTYRIVDKSGDIRWVFEKAQMIESHETDYEVVQGLMLDITDMRKMAEELRQSETRFELLVKSMHDLVITVDTDYIVSGVYGSTADLPAGIVPSVNQRLTEYLPGSIADVHLQYLLLAEQGLPQSFEWKINQHDFDWYLLTSVNSVTHDDKDLQGFVLVVKDITEMKLAEIERREIDKKIQQAQRLESLGLMAGGIAHDFNNLLTGVMGHTSLAMDRLLPGSSLHTELMHIETATQYASELVKQMLAYSGQSTIQKSVVDIGEIIQNMIQLLSIAIPKDVTITTDIQPHLEPVEADPVQVQQVLMNIVINAGEAIGDHAGEIRILASARKISKEELAQGFTNNELSAGSYTVVQITDTGCGMDAETMAKMYDPFYTTKFTGRGLGMAAVLGIMQGHRGGIHVTSSPGDGSCFTLIFPSVQQQVTKMEKQTTPAWIPKPGLCALIVDDEEGIRLVASAILHRIGFGVEFAEDGQQGVDMVTANPGKYDLVLMDLTMPRMDGEEALKLIKQINPDLPVIISSGFAETDMPISTFSRKFDAFLQKPYRMEQVRELVAQVLKISKPE